MGEERRFRSHFQVVGERRRQRIHDDRRLYRARSPAQCWRSKKNGPQAIGRSRGGLTTKIHALVDALGNPVELMLTPGQDHDLTCAEPLIENADPEALIGDKAYDADPFVETLTQRGITPVIPPKANRNIKRECDFALYCERNLVERFFNLLKHFRAIRHTLRQACEKFPRRGAVGCRYNPPQLNTGPSFETKFQRPDPVVKVISKHYYIALYLPRRSCQRATRRNSCCWWGGLCKPRAMTANSAPPNGWRCASSPAPTRSPGPHRRTRHFKRRRPPPHHKNG